MPQNYLNTFRGPNLAEIDRSAYSNSLLKNEVDRVPQRNRAEDLAIEADQATISQQQRQNAAGILANRFAAVASSPRPRDAARAFIGGAEFQTAGKLVGLPTEKFQITDQDDDASIQAQARAWAQALGMALESPQQFGEPYSGPGGSLLQAGPGGEVRSVVGREPGIASQPAAPAGYRWAADGGMEIVPGGPADLANRPKPLTEGDKRNSLMFDSMVNAEQQIQAMTAGGNNTNTSSKWDALLGLSGLTVAQSDEYKQYETAGLRWAANLLYLKSGATATPDEIRSTWKQFFPQPGDGPSVVQQKDAARIQEMQSAGRITGGEVPSFGAQPQAVSGGGEVAPEGTVIQSQDGRTMVKRNGQWVPQ